MKITKKTAIIMLGAPGSGKGTQGKLIEDNSTYKRYVMSDLIKKELKLARKKWAKSYDITNGLLLGDSEIFELFRDNFKGENHIILDGIPRTLDQAYWLYGFLTQHGYDLEIIFLNVDEKKLLDRILERAKVQGRKDDNPEIFKERLEIFDNVKSVILKVYKGNILNINGDRKVDIIHKDIMKKLKLR
jgi:adenylate kinase